MPHAATPMEKIGRGALHEQQTPEDLLIRLSVTNRSAETAVLTILPALY